MASETDYKEAPFADEDGLHKDLPVKVHIIAPSTLPEGYVFEAEVGAPGAKKTINVEVVSDLLRFVWECVGLISLETWGWCSLGRGGASV